MHRTLLDEEPIASSGLRNPHFPPPTEYRDLEVCLGRHSLLATSHLTNPFYSDSLLALLSTASIALVSPSIVASTPPAFLRRRFPGLSRSAVFTLQSVNGLMNGRSS